MIREPSPQKLLSSVAGYFRLLDFPGQNPLEHAPATVSRPSRPKVTTLPRRTAGVVRRLACVRWCALLGARWLVRIRWCALLFVCIAWCALVGASWLVHVGRRVPWCALLGLRWLVRVGWCTLVGGRWCALLGAGGSGAGGRADGSASKKQKPDTMMWGKARHNKHTKCEKNKTKKQQQLTHLKCKIPKLKKSKLERLKNSIKT